MWVFKPVLSYLSILIQTVEQGYIRLFEHSHSDSGPEVCVCVAVCVCSSEDKVWTMVANDLPSQSLVSAELETATVLELNYSMSSEQVSSYQKS